jgi:hypothetical protein
MSQPPKKKRVPLGNPVRWNDKDLDHLSAISPADLKASEALWERNAPKPLKSLLQAQVMESEEK